MRLILTYSCILISFAVTGQDTIRIMHYNLLNYGNNYGDCNSSNNNVGDKNEYLKTIVDYLNPDVLTVNEIDDGQSHHNSILNNVFNVDGSTAFDRGNPPNLGYSPIMNEIYYNTEKLKLLSNVAIETNYRDIDIFTFVFKNSLPDDSIFLHNVVAHLKAGSDPEDEQERASETYKLMNYLNNNNLDGNYLLCGDLNLRSGFESAFQNLIAHTNEDIRFYDPINKVGEWHDATSYASIHTQSTHLSGGCPAGGGMDDRFDFILASDEIMQGIDHVQYVTGSYSAVGQDGQRINHSLLTPDNNSAPQEVLSALYSMSDHLPLIVDLAVGKQIGSTETKKSPVKLTYTNPARNHILLSVSLKGSKQTEIQLLNPFGSICYSETKNIAGSGNFKIPVSGLGEGLYFLRVNSSGDSPLSVKVIVVQ